MASQEPADASPVESGRVDVEMSDSPARRQQIGPPTTPLYQRLARKEARVREDQYVALSRLVSVLARRRTDRSGPRLTENTLIRVAIDVLLSRANRLTGNTESELRASALNHLPAPPTHADRQGGDQ